MPFREIPAKSIELVRKYGKLEEFEEEGDDTILIFPITDIDDEDGHYSQFKNHVEDAFHKSPYSNKLKPLMTLKQRRRSLLDGATVPEVSTLRNRFDSGVHDLSLANLSSLSPKNRWKVAVKKIRKMKDPWNNFDFDRHPAERVTRHRYNALTRKWMVDEAAIKMEDEPFNRGAMRSCFRLKKLMKIRSRDKDRSLDELVTTLSCNHGWSALSNNCIAKKYMEDVDREVYFHDVELQMDAKLWGAEYNRHKPPKQVDIIQMAVLEFKDRPCRPLYHLENFIEGEYKKYNSNSGFVEAHWRMTPQAFTHFTFERSNHQMMVVDIQGVGDLYTDPQIHTFDGVQYGDGNLGIRGMALFFHSHVCNDICRSLGLSVFDLYKSEIHNIVKIINGHGDPNHSEKATQVRGTEEAIDVHPLIYFPPSFNQSSIGSFGSSQDGQKKSTNSTPNSDDEDGLDEGMISPQGGSSFSYKNKHFLSGSDSSATTNEEDEKRWDQMKRRKMSRPCCVKVEMEKRSLEINKEKSILGLIHHELAKYHEMGRFVKDGEDIDAKAALFHERQAADLGVGEAALTLAYIQLGIPHDILSSITVENKNKELGFEYMKMAAHEGDRKAMLFLAKAYETGFGLPNGRSPSYPEAINWYERALIDLEHHGSAGEGFDSTIESPPYLIRATMARMYLVGGQGLERDANRAGDLYDAAAEGATEAMNGKLANKYYTLSEEAYSAIEK